MAKYKYCLLVYSYVEQRCFDDFTQLLDLFFASANITVGNIGFVLDLHHRYRWVDLGRQRNVNLVLVAIDTASSQYDKMMNLVVTFHTQPKVGYAICDAAFTTYWFNFNALYVLY